jgi:hypothetical protein
MMWESCFWKEDLQRLAHRLEQRCAAKRWSNRAGARVEKVTMVGFFIIRRIIEAKARLSDSTVQRLVPVSIYTSRSTRITSLNWRNIDRHFDLDHPRRLRIRLPELCNQFIHSYVFTIVGHESGGLEGILVASEYRRRSALYHVRIKQIINLFRLVARDDPDHANASFDPKIQDYRVSAWTGKSRRG